MKEELLHFIWQSKALLPLILSTTTGQPLKIIRTGILNRDAGPDFFNSCIQIGDTTWAGNVEMHVQSSMWDAHGHQHDRKYGNVVLHVVYHHDREVLNTSGQPIPVLELRNYISPLMLRKYELLHKGKATVPCENIFALPPQPVVGKWMERLLIERLEKKCGVLQELLQSNNGNWEDAFYKITARHFGMNVNAPAFEQLAARLPLTVLSKAAGTRQTEALVFGVAGFLTAMKTSDRYALALRTEYMHLKSKFNLTEMDVNAWKFSRTRPANFPTVRLAQFAALTGNASHLLADVLAAESVQILHSRYDIPVNNKLNIHAFRSLRGKAIAPAPGPGSISLLLINTVLPVVFWYGKVHKNDNLSEKALRLYEEIKGENNTVTRYWNRMGLPAKTAFDSQALIQMQTHYCNHLRCLSCAIGTNLLLKSSA